MPRGSRAERGKRTGVELPEDVAQDADGMQNVDTFFDQAQTPGFDEKKDDESAPRSVRKSARKTTRSAREMRFSLEGQVGQTSPRSSKRLQGKNNNKFSALKSPSELSGVTTLPPTPKDPEADELPTQEVEVPRQAHNEDDAIEHPALLDATPGGEFLTQEDDPFEDNDLAPPVGDDDDEDDFPEAIIAGSEAMKETDLTEVGDQKMAAKNTQDLPLEDSDDDDDKEGSGFNMVHDPETPKSLQTEDSRRGRKKKSRKSIDSEVTPAPKNAKKGKKRKVLFSPEGVPVANRDYNHIPLSHLVQPSPDDPSQEGLRRSGRVRCQPLQYWKNERLEYGPADDVDEDLAEAMGDMPVVKHVVRALPTPRQKRQPPKKKPEKKSKKRKSEDAEVEETPFDATRLKRKYKDNLRTGDSANVWDDSNDDSNMLKVISYADQMVAAALPHSETRTKDEGDVVGEAAQAFNVDGDPNGNYAGYIMGNLKLPPKGIKDAESVGPCSQTFTVCTGQKGAIEVAFSDPDGPEGVLDIATAQRFLLGPGDLFRVPPGNTYRLQNHSKTKSCLLTWTIIRPLAHP